VKEMNEKETKQFNDALREAAGDTGGLDFFAELDTAKPPVERIYAAVDGVTSDDEKPAAETRTRPTRRRKFYRVSFAAAAACFVVLISSVAVGGGFDPAHFGLGGTAEDGSVADGQIDNGFALMLRPNTDEPSGSGTTEAAADVDGNGGSNDTASGSSEGGANETAADADGNGGPDDTAVGSAEGGAADPKDNAASMSDSGSTQQDESAAQDSENASGAGYGSSRESSAAKSQQIRFGILTILAAALLGLMLLISSRVQEPVLGALYRIKALRVVSIAAAVLIIAAGMYLLVIML
jgi:hypothetical protein